jgi:hypothetical protein
MTKRNLTLPVMNISSLVTIPSLIALERPIKNTRSKLRMYISIHLDIYIYIHIYT